MFHSLQLHLVGECPFTGQDRLPLKIAVDHEDRRRVVVQLPDDNRHGLLSGQFTGTVPPVACHQLVAALGVRPGNGRYQDAEPLHALHGLPHGVVVQYLKGMIAKGMQLLQRQLHHLLPLGVCPDLVGGEEIIDRSQLYLLRVVFRAAAPPW